MLARVAWRRERAAARVKQGSSQLALAPAPLPFFAPLNQATTGRTIAACAPRRHRPSLGTHGKEASAHRPRPAAAADAAQEAAHAAAAPPVRWVGTRAGRRRCGGARVRAAARRLLVRLCLPAQAGAPARGGVPAFCWATLLRVLRWGGGRLCREGRRRQSVQASREPCAHGAAGSKLGRWVQAGAPRPQVPSRLPHSTHMCSRWCWPARQQTCRPRAVHGATRT